MIKLQLDRDMGPPFEWQGPSDYIEFLASWSPTFTFKHEALFLVEDILIHCIADCDFLSTSSYTVPG